MFINWLLLFIADSLDQNEPIIRNHVLPSKKESAIEALAQQQTNWNQLKRNSTYTEMKETNPEHEQQELTMNFNPVSVELKTRKKT